MKFLARALMLVAIVSSFAVLGPLNLGISPAYAALNDACTVPVSLLPGLEDINGDCQASLSPAEGDSCGNSLFYNSLANQCVADNGSCDSGAGSYQSGVCTPNPTPPAPASPATPTGFTVDPTAGSAPAGDQQPMCVNASPFIGGGVFVVSGTVLCYTGAGKGTNIYAYTDDGANSGGWNPFNPSSWDSLSLKDLYASDDVTVLGTLTSFGGAQLYSMDGRSGLQVNDNGVLIGSSDVNGNVSTVNTTPTSVAISSTDGTSTSSLTVSGGGGIEVTAALVDDNGPAVRISGGIASTSAAQIGVIIQGDGQGNQTAPVNAPANWADVLIASKGYNGSGNGAGIVVNDYGTTVRSATTGSTYNEFGSGAANQSGSVLTNVIGSGGAGTVNNYLGVAGDAGTTVTNEIGTAGNGGVTVNRIGNTNALTTFSATAGTSSMMVVQGALDFVTGQGASILTSPTQQVSGGNAVAMLGTSTHYTTVDANGAISVVNGVAPEASNGLYIVNGYGQTNGVAVNERQTVMSGGESTPSTLTLSDTGAHYSNSSNGEPIIVSGVADGVNPFDSPNIRQLDSGLASVAALTGLPAPQVGKRNVFGVAMGHHNSGTAMAIGGQSQLGDNVSVKYGTSLSYASGRIDSTSSVGVGVSW